jgi:hypothetical protein
MNDVRVVSLIMHPIFIEDISISVPQGATVNIPAARASKSKDLWRLINQKQLFRLNQGPGADHPHAPPLPPPPALSNAENERLREEKRVLEEQNQLLRQTLLAQGGKLDTILGLLESGRLVAAVPVPQAAPSAPTKVNGVDYGVVDAGVPTFIPSEIKPRNVESHITEVKAVTSEGSGVAGAGEALRKLRRKSS